MAEHEEQLEGDDSGVESSDATQENNTHLVAAQESAPQRSLQPQTPPSTKAVSSKNFVRASSLDWRQREDEELKVASDDADSGLPSFLGEGDRPQSGLSSSGSVGPLRETVVVINANSSEGISMVRALARTSNVRALVRVFTSKTTKTLLRIPNVVVKVADLYDLEELTRSIGPGVKRTFVCLKYWEYFETKDKERQAILIVGACAANGVKHVIFSSFEDIEKLKKKGQKSQITPNSEGIVQPKFLGMKTLQKQAKACDMQLTHMLTSYLDQTHSKKSLCLIRGQNGRLIIKPHMS